MRLNLSVHRRPLPRLQYREGQAHNYKVGPRDGRPPQDTSNSARQSTAPLVSGTRRPIDSADRPERALPAPLSQLGSLARDFVSIELGKYLESVDFISDNPSILAKYEINALIAEALTAEKGS